MGTLYFLSTTPYLTIAETADVMNLTRQRVYAIKDDALGELKDGKYRRESVIRELLLRSIRSEMGYIRRLPEYTFSNNARSEIVTIEIIREALQITKTDFGGAKLHDVCVFQWINLVFDTLKELYLINTPIYQQMLFNDKVYRILHIFEDIYREENDPQVKRMIDYIESQKDGFSSYRLFRDIHPFHSENRWIHDVVEVYFPKIKDALQSLALEMIVINIEIFNMKYPDLLEASPDIPYALSKLPWEDYIHRMYFIIEGEHYEEDLYDTYHHPMCTVYRLFRQR